MKTAKDLKNVLLSSTIAIYNNLFKLFDDNIEVETMNKLTQDEKDYFNSFLDYEPVSFIVVDGKNVIIFDSISGDIFDVITLKKLFKNSMKDYAENN